MSSSNTVSVAGNSQSSTASLYDGAQQDWNYGIKVHEEEENLHNVDHESNDDNIAGDDCSNFADNGELEESEEGVEEYVDNDSEIPTTSAEMEVSSTVFSSNSNNSSDCNIETASSNSDSGNKIVFTSVGNIILQQQQPPISFQQQQNKEYRPSNQPSQVKSKRFVQMNTVPKFQQRTMQQQNFLPISTTSAVVTSNPSIKIVQSTGIPTTIAQQRPKTGSVIGNTQTNKGRKSTNSKLPPGAVNLERSYQICQAVIQNSKNRQQLSAQLRPPLSMAPKCNLNGGNSINTSSQYVKNEKSCSTELISSNNIGKTFYKVQYFETNVYIINILLIYIHLQILNPNFRKKYVHRQPSPTMIRHMYSSVQDQSQQNAQQFVLLHRANQLNQTPRASSAPPTQNQVTYSYKLKFI